MKFIYTAGQYTCFMGRQFAFKKATEVTDKATIAALLKHPDFVRVDDEKQEERSAQAPAMPIPVMKRPTLFVKGRK